MKKNNEQAHILHAPTGTVTSHNEWQGMHKKHIYAFVFNGAKFQIKNDQSSKKIGVGIFL